MHMYSPCLNLYNGILKLSTFDQIWNLVFMSLCPIHLRFDIIRINSEVTKYHQSPIVLYQSEFF